jgi:hypothetical protein
MDPNTRRPVTRDNRNATGWIAAVIVAIIIIGSLVYYNSANRTHTASTSTSTSSTPTQTAPATGGSSAPTTTPPATK